MTGRPNFFIIGAPKSGTTSLYEYLEGHPDVYMSPVKEPGYFSPDVVGGHERKYRYGEDEARYLSLFAKAGGAKRQGEASTRYLLSRQAPELIRDFDPQARIIAILRNPVDMMYALHNERVSNGVEEIGDFDEAIAADADRAAGRRMRPGANELWSVYRNTARYAENLDGWFAALPRDQLKIIIFDDFAADTPAAFRDILEFLGIDTDYQPASFEVRRSSHRRRGGPLRLITGLPPVQWVVHGLMPKLVGEGAAGRLVWSYRQSRLNRKRHVRPALRSEVRRQLEAELTPDVERLSQILGRDLVTEWFGGEDRRQKTATGAGAASQR